MFNTAILLGTLAAILLVIGWLIAGVIGMTIALFIAIAINIISYWYSDKFVLKMYRAKPLHNEHIQSMVEKLAHEAKIPKPKLYSIPSDVPNAFATGRNPEHSAIAVTQGLLHLDKEEIEGVLSHEIGHIKNRDILVQTLAATIAGAIAYVAQIGYWSMFMGRGRRDEGNVLMLILMVIFAPLAALLIRMAISRSREYKADRTGALLTKNPRGLSSALRRISQIARHHPIKGSSATSHMWIVNPFHKDWFTGLFSTHPPIEKRIERLEELKAN